MVDQNITSILEYVKIDRFYVSCYFKCNLKNKTVVSTVPFEPYEGKIELSWQDIIFHPIQSWDKYYHTPITIYNSTCNDTIVQKAFEKVSKQFTWDKHTQNYIYIKEKNV